MQDILIPGYSPPNLVQDKNPCIFPSPIFGLAEIDDVDVFDSFLNDVNNSIVERFWKEFTNVFHYGLKNEEKNNNVGFPFLVFLISKKKSDHAEKFLKKYPESVNICSVQNWSPLHEAVEQQCKKSIHFLMRAGADPEKIGTRDKVEKRSSAFGNKHISPMMMAKTFHREMLLYMSFEVNYRERFGKYGYDTDHFCTDLCEEELKKYEVNDFQKEREERNDVL